MSNADTMITQLSNRLGNTFIQNGAPTPEDADIVGDMVAAAADYFESHPNSWLLGGYHQGSRFCNVGLLSASYGSPLAATFTMAQRVAFGKQDRMTAMLIDLNDSYAASKRLNIIGLRFVADVLYHIATPEWTVQESIQAVTAEYRGLYGKDSALATDELQARRDRKNDQVREARRLAKLGGYKSVTAMRKALVLKMSA